MNKWDARWMALCKQNNIKLCRSDRYMDDIRAFLKSLSWARISLMESSHAWTSRPG
jgi:hypothetical protein